MSTPRAKGCLPCPAPPPEHVSSDASLSLPACLYRSLRGLVHIWSLQTRRVVATLDGHGGQCVTWLQTLPQGPQLLRWV